MKVKRYVFEYSRDVMRSNEPKIRSGEQRHPKADQILDILRHCGRGRISCTEAVRAISDADVAARGMSWNVREQRGEMQ